jgi:hypothetical protein
MDKLIGKRRENTFIHIYFTSFIKFVNQHKTIIDLLLMWLHIFSKVKLDDRIIWLDVNPVRSGLLRGLRKDNFAFYVQQIVD